MHLARSLAWYMYQSWDKKILFFKQGYLFIEHLFIKASW